MGPVRRHQGERDVEGGHLGKAVRMVYQKHPGSFWVGLLGQLLQSTPGPFLVVAIEAATAGLPLLALRHERGVDQPDRGLG